MTWLLRDLRDGKNMLQVHCPEDMRDSCLSNVADGRGSASEIDGPFGQGDSAVRAVPQRILLAFFHAVVAAGTYRVGDIELGGIFRAGRQRLPRRIGGEQ